MYIRFLDGVRDPSRSTYREVVAGPFDYAYVAPYQDKTVAIVGQARGDEDSDVVSVFRRGKWEVKGHGSFEEARFTPKRPK